MLTSYPQSESSREGALEKVLANIASVKNVEDCQHASEALLDAVGNNHAGTYLPVIVDVIPSLGALLMSGTPWTQLAILDALIDLYGSFGPDPSVVEFAAPGSLTSVSLEKQFHHAVQELKSAIELVASADTVATRSAAELLELIANVQ